MTHALRNGTPSPPPPGPTFHPGRVPAAAACAALLIIAVEAAVAWRGHRLDDGLRATTLAKRAAIADIAAGRSPAPAALVLGDSRMFAVEPAALATLTSGPVLNLSWPMMGAEGPDLMLAAILRSIPRASPAPRTIFISPPAELWALPAASLDLRRHDDYKARLFTAAPPAALAAELAARGEIALLRDHLAFLAQPPTLLRRASLHQWLANHAAGRREPVTTPNDRREMAEHAATGAFAMYGDATVTDANLSQVERIVGPYGLYDNPAALAAWDRFRTRARDAAIEIRWLPLPMPEPVFDDWERTGALAAVRTWSATGAATTGPLFLRWPRHLFGDAAHLNRGGADRYRQFLSSRLPVSAPLR